MKIKGVFNIFKQDDGILSYTRRWVLLALLVGICCGAVMIGFYLAISGLRLLFTGVPVYLSMIVGGVVAAIFIRFRKRDTNGTGIPYYIKCRRGAGDIRLSDVGAHFVTSAVAIGSGCIAGKESPAVFMGGGIALWLARLLRFPKVKRNLTLTIGGAAATAAIFQAPLGGSIFAAEIPYKHDLDAPEYMPAFLASLISYFTFKLGILWITDDYPHLLDLNISSSLNSPLQLLNSLIVGIVTGLVGVVFVYTFHLARQKFAPLFRPEFAVLVGISITALGSFIALCLTKTDLPFGGTGFHILNYIENGPHISIEFLSVILVGTILASSLTVGMGISGGVFGPSLVIGGCVGGIIGLIVDPENVSAYVVIGMSASHAASTKTPIASMILILEMSGFPPIFIAMAIANIAAFFVSGSKSLYFGQISDRLEELVHKIGDMDIISLLKVKDIMDRNSISVEENQTVSVVKQLFADSGKQSLPIINNENVLRGVITLNDVGNKGDHTLIRHILKEKPVVVTPDTSIKDALALLFDQETKGIAVVDNKGRFSGFLTMKDIITACRHYVSTD